VHDEARLPWQQQAIQAKCFHPTGTFIEFRKEAIEQSIPARFEQQVRQYPTRLAVKTGRHALTYDALNQAANRVARAILVQRGEGEEPIALLLAPDTSIVAAILGVLKAGKFYIALDPSLSPVRRTAMLDEAQAGLVITSNTAVACTSPSAQHGPRWLNMDALDASLPTENLRLSVSPDALCCIHYTSGSTGQPKGVLQNHRNILHNIRNYTNGVHLCADDRLALLHSYSFSASTMNVFGALLNGAALLPFHLPDAGLTRLASWLIQQDITIYYTGPSVFRHFVSTLTGEEQFPALRLIRLVGESVTSRDVALYKKHFAADCLFVNAMGSAETFVFRQYCIDKATPIPEGIVPVGYGFAWEDMELVLLDETGAEVEGHGIGETSSRAATSPQATGGSRP
jgi:non-ribosomal peptide synthetase component F